MIAPPSPPAPGILRRLVRRIRALLLGPVPAELAAIRAQQDAILRRLDQMSRDTDAALDGKLERAIDRALQALVVERDG